MRCLFAVSSWFVQRASLTVYIDPCDVTNRYYTILYRTVVVNEKKNRSLVFSGSGFFCPHWIYLSHIPVSALGKNTKQTAARWPYADPWRHCNVNIASPCRISAYSRFSGRLLQAFFNINEVLYSEQENNSSFVWGWDRKIRPSWSPFVITRQASWCQSVILVTDFSISPSHSW